MVVKALYDMTLRGKYALFFEVRVVFAVAVAWDNQVATSGVPCFSWLQWPETTRLLLLAVFRVRVSLLESTTHWLGFDYKYCNIPFFCGALHDKIWANIILLDTFHSASNLSEEQCRGAGFGSENRKRVQRKPLPGTRAWSERFILCLLASRPVAHTARPSICQYYIYIFSKHQLTCN